jgi:hypothetical protein
MSGLNKLLTFAKVGAFVSSSESDDEALLASVGWT